MTRTERALARRWKSLALIAVLLFLSGGGILGWQRLDGEVRRGDQLAAEADLRGDAVSTLAGDVRVLRAQLEAEGETPRAPDPADAVEDLPNRAEVPVPIPGPPGPPGPAGSPGTDGTDGTSATGSPGAPGPTGAAGTSGTDGVAGPAGPAGPQGDPGPAGPQGPAGANGADGRDGADGQDGQTCPDGYSLHPPTDDPDALVCRRNGAPSPSDSPQGGLLGVAVLAGSAAYRRL